MTPLSPSSQVLSPGLVACQLGVMRNTWAPGGSVVRGQADHGSQAWRGVLEAHVACAAPQQRPGDRQAKSAASAVSVPGLVEPREAVEDPVAVLDGDAVAVVGD